jgi:outer membrane protein
MPRQRGKMKGFEMKARTTAVVLALGGLALTGGGASAQTLQESLVSAYRQNPQLQAERARQRATDEDVSRAWGGYRPQVVANGSRGRAKDKITYPPTPADSFTPGVENIISDYRSPETEALQITQNIWDGNRTLADVKHSKWAVANGREILSSVEQTVLGTAVQAYYDLYRDQKILDVQKEYVRSLEDERKATEARFKVKDVTQTDVAQADARLARGIADQQLYQGNVDSSRSAFIRAVGFPPGILPEPPAMPATLPQTLPDALALAEDNPDLKAAVYAEQAAQSDVDFAESGLLPSLSLQATSARSVRTDYTGASYYNGQILLNLSVPLYDGGVASARTRAAKHTAGQRRLDIDMERDTVVDQVKRSWDNLAASRARIRSLQETAKATETALRGVQQELKVGSRTVLDELNARQEVLDTEINLLRSQHDEAIAAYSLQIAVGRMTAAGLDLPVDRYDPKAHYESVRWLPWGPWIGTDYPESPKAELPQ